LRVPPERSGADSIARIRILGLTRTDFGSAARPAMPARELLGAARPWQAISPETVFRLVFFASLEPPPTPSDRLQSNHDGNRSPGALDGLQAPQPLAQHHSTVGLTWRFQP